MQYLQRMKCKSIQYYHARNITNIGRYGISLFTIGLFAISTGIDLLITKAKVADMKTKKWSEFRQVIIQQLSYIA